MRFSIPASGLFLAAAGLMTLGCSPDVDKTRDEKPSDPEPPVKIEDISVGDGPAAEKGDWVEIHYTGWLPDGTQFDSSIDQQKPISFQVGGQQPVTSIVTAMKGFDLGVRGMKEGGRRRITIPPELAFGNRSIGGIPANSAVVLEIDLLRVKK